MALTQANPLLNHQGLPKFSEITPAHVEPAVKEGLEILQKKLEALESHITPTWAGLLEPLEDMSLILHHLWSPISHLNGVANSEPLRQAYQNSQPLVVAFGLRFGQSEPIYQGLKKIRNSSEWSRLDEGQQRIIESKIKDAELSGIGLAEGKRKEFNDLMQELSEAQTKFANNVLDATKNYRLIITDKQQMQGLPDFYYSQASTAYNRLEGSHAEKTSSSTPESGPWLITLDGPSYQPFIENCADRNTREKIYRAQISRASAGDVNNQDLMRKILLLRKRKAKILGYNNYAELSLARKMAPSVEAVYQLEEELRETAWKPALAELEEIRAFAKSQGATQEVKNWDIPYWSKRLQEHKFSYTDEELRPYFSLPKVLDGLFQLVQHIFQIKVKPCDGETSVWHPDVRFFRIYSESNEPLAAFFLDPYSRPENKRGGAWMDDCVGRHVRKNKITLPVAYLVCNSTPPMGDKPSLMTFREVETLFHEFGHGLQHMLTRVNHLDASGINNVEWDAVELPSQFMENWCYHKATLMSFAKHYETGEAMPSELFAKLLQARTYMAGMGMLRQLQFGLIDLELHSTFDPEGEETPFAVQRRVAKNTAVMPPLPEDRFLCSFTHIFAGGYAAGYYSYKWAEVLSADAFQAFEEAGLDNPQATKAVGLKFRETVLAFGGAKHPMAVFQAFRGRAPSTKALLLHNGL